MMSLRDNSDVGEVGSSHLSKVINDAEIQRLLRQRNGSLAHVREILGKARELHGLSGEEVVCLMDLADPEAIHELHETAGWVKNEIYGSRLVLFAPLYISNACANECSYCAFRRLNADLERRTLTQEEISEEVQVLIKQGHKRLLMVSGEAQATAGGLDYLIESIRTIYAARNGTGQIRRVNVNVAPLSFDQYRRLKEEKIGTYQLFQETYHEPSYRRYHLAGPKRDYRWRLTAMDRAMEAGFGDVGIGALFGLYHWRYELLALLQHARRLEREFGVGPHTISVPRIEPATGSEIAQRPPYPVSDEDFLKIIAILRIAVPYTGIIMSTRESAAIRGRTVQLGVSQISAGSRTDPGGYSTRSPSSDGQFQLGDHRPLDEVVLDAVRMGMIPSFCTGCYRMGRTGRDFMDLAKPGEIKKHCDPNGLSTFQEYLLDYASEKTRAEGEELIQKRIQEMPEARRQQCTRMIDLVKGGRRDVFV